MEWDALSLLLLAVSVTWLNLATAELDDATVQRLLQQVPEIPTIPTKNGYYIFVPSPKCNCESKPKSQLMIRDGITEKYKVPQLRGVNRAGLEYPCIQGWGLVDGPTDDASIQAMKKWNVEIVRLPLNEDCWLGINGVNGALSGENYRKAVSDYVKRLRSHGLRVILDLHWSDGVYTGQGSKCGDHKATCQKPMPDAENAPKFWKSVAHQFKNDDGIIFDLFSNPSPDKAIINKNLAWKCWKNGGSACSGFQYEIAGMQDLVNAVRETGANNPLMVSGIRSGNDLSQFVKYAPNDPKGKIIASWHSFNDDVCNNENCWQKEIAPVGAKYSIIAGEIAEKGCTHNYIDKLMNWLDKKEMSYLGWTWNPWDCSSGPSLISDFSGTPTEYGKGLRNRMTGKMQTTSPSTGSNTGSSNPGSNSPIVKKPGSSSSSPAGTIVSKSKQLRGVNRSGAEYSCIKQPGQGGGILEGPTDNNAIKAMKKWNINVVRIPLNADCWLGVNGHYADYTGKHYRTAVVNYVNRLRENELNVILDLHWTNGQGTGPGSCSDVAAVCQKPMPDKQYAPKFWESVAKTFINDYGIIFDLFNEPFPDKVMEQAQLLSANKVEAWKCLRDGGNACSGFSYEVAGMQDLVNAVRSTGAKNTVMVPGLTWSNDLSSWLQYLPKDPENNIAASWHSYDFNRCNAQSCWDSEIAPVAAKYPVVVGEIGQHGCSHWYIDLLMKWLDQHKISYLGWTWNTWDCSNGPALISNYDGTPTEFGRGLRDHLTKN